jgi:hypothetical protein
MYTTGMTPLKVTRVLIFLVTQNDAKVTCHSFKILRVLSSDVWQQTVYNPAIKIDSVRSTETWADLNSVSRTYDLIFYRSLLKTGVLVHEKDIV